MEPPQSSQPRTPRRKLVCQVEGCSQPLSDLKAYHRRYKICLEHLKAPVVLVKGTQCRFCQQCGRFHDLQEFEGTRRSCRSRLDRHNRRRRLEGVLEKQREELEEADQESPPDEHLPPASSAISAEPASAPEQVANSHLLAQAMPAAADGSPDSGDSYPAEYNGPLQPVQIGRIHLRTALSGIQDPDTHFSPPATSYRQTFGPEESHLPLQRPNITSHATGEAHLSAASEAHGLITDQCN